ncbi:MAG TPA: transcription antitermination factor NusB [Steroidobacteraceae bacterium]|nr:transcription antitermination factor NusB [Steroidobacteraceae bacterium]
MSARSEARPAAHARAAARTLALQALYRWQLNRCSWQELVEEFAAETSARRADAGYFEALIRGVCAQHEQLDAALAPLLDRRPAELDPIEHALLLIGSYELRERPELPFRIIVSEAVGLARRFGATDGHKFVNAVLDHAARLWRPGEAA